MRKHYANRQAGYTDTYTIEFREGPRGTIVPVCLEHPRNPFDPSAGMCHLYSDGRICIREGREPRNMETAEAVVHYWMVGYSQYVRTGTFPDHGGRVNV